MSMDAAEAKVVRKVSRRLLGFLILLYIFAYLDRINIGFAALAMNKSLGLTQTMFGVANTFLYVGYFAFEIPSNLLLARFGARVWLARILITWGFASAATAFATGPASLDGLRSLVGIAEAGFVPGILFYITLWWPAEHRARANALFMLAQPLAMAFGSPISGAILDSHGALGLRPWQWLFILEGLPSVALGVVAYFYLTDRPRSANWLTEDEKATLERSLDTKASPHPRLAWRELFRREMVLLALAYFGLIMTLNTIATWTPQIVRAVLTRHSFSSIGLLAAAPALCAVIAMPLWSRHSDRQMERAWHTIVPYLLAALGWTLVALAAQPEIRFAGLVCCFVGGFCGMSIFWTLPQAILAPADRPAGIAFVSSCGILASMATPPLIGRLVDLTHSFVSGLLLLAGVLVVASLLVGMAGRRRRKIASELPRTF
jgi:ACS family 4-hydroxyphenylacetate permease-like MFS transporter